MLSGLPELWTLDLAGQDGRDILLEDLDFIFRFIGLHFVTAHGVSNFRALENLINTMLHMAHYHDAIGAKAGPYSPHWLIGLDFRKYAANVLTDCITELMER